MWYSSPICLPSQIIINSFLHSNDSCLRSLRQGESPSLISLLSSRNNLRRPRDVTSEDFSLNEPRQPHCQLVVDELLRWDREDLCKMLVGRYRRVGVEMILRSISSRVSCLVSLTKQKIMNQAMRLRPA
jgi:hypothetical protein